jgi:hypothetical protein
MANSTLFQPLIFGFLSAFVWGTYGWYIRDIPIIIPNAIGIVLCTIQLVLYAYYAQVKEEPAGVASSVAGNAVKIAGRGSNGRYSVVPKSLGGISRLAFLAHDCDRRTRPLVSSDQ